MKDISKKAILEKARKKLKKHYRGIDKQIDALIDSITGWYLGTNIDDRPTIVNMWSITGLGKTSLIRMLMQELYKADRLVEITLDNEASNDRKTVLHKVSRTVGNSRNGLCLFIDEFQNMQTIDSNGNPVRNTPYQDLWTLLSDGRFFTKEDFTDNIINTFDVICGYWVTLHRNLSLVFDALGKLDSAKYEPIKQELELWKSRVQSFDNNYEHHLSSIGCSVTNIPEKVDDMLYTIGYTDSYQAEDIEKFVEKISQLVGDSSIYQLFKVNVKYDYSRVLSALKASMMQHIDLKTFNSMVKSFKKEAEKLVKSDVDSLLRATNLLVIIAGNQDSLFEGSKDLVYTYKDVDELYDINKKLRWFDLKQLLLESIRPEQVSRLGMNHIIYPTLNEKAYNQIIDDRLGIIHKRVLKDYGIDLSFTKNLKSVIYRNGVFPTQGVRPLLSLVDNMIGSAIIQLSSTLKCKTAEVDIDNKKKELVISNKAIKRRKGLLLEISDKEEDGNGKSRLRFAVHEAGHAIVWMFTTGLPVEIDMAPVSFTAGAWTRMKMPDNVFEEIGGLHIFDKARITTTLGGRMAEESVFGEEYLSSGCWGDLEHATKRALDLVRACGYTSSTNNGIMSFVHPNDINSPTMMTIDDDSIQKDAITILNDCKSECIDILTLCKPVLIDLVNYLMDNIFLDVKCSKKFLANINSIRESAGVKPLKSFDSNKLWKRFIK